MVEKKISRPTWQKNLQGIWKLLQSKGYTRAAIVGVGQEFNGDDLAGVAIAHQLEERVGEKPTLLIIEAGSAPENITGTLRRFQPHLVVIVDAAQMGGYPGTARLISTSEIAGFTVSTHSLPLNVFSAYVESEFSCVVVVLGIQVERIAMGDTISPLVAEAIPEIVERLAQIFQA